VSDLRETLGVGADLMGTAFEGTGHPYQKNIIKVNDGTKWDRTPLVDAVKAKLKESKATEEGASTQ
jgi:hypothetical protein